jgi:hypothetical protein
MSVMFSIRPWFSTLVDIIKSSPDGVLKTETFRKKTIEENKYHTMVYDLFQFSLMIRLGSEI